MKQPNWTPEKIALLDSKLLKELLKNATRRGASEVERLCLDELSKRAPSGRRTRSEGEQRVGDYVAGYHFVCERDRGIRHEADGTFWSGSWVVSKKNVELSLKYGAYVALHEQKNKLSYRLGRIIGFKIKPREMVDKENFGIEFHLVALPSSLEWVGSGAGEKGYHWKKLREPENN